MATKKINIRLKKDDLVKIRSGSEKGKTGKVKKVDFKNNKLVVEGVNVKKMSTKPTKANPQGGIIEVEKPIPVSKAGFVFSASEKPSKIVYKIENGKKIRIAKSSNKRIDK